MEIRIGVQHSPREIVLESEEKSDALIERLSGAIADGSPVTLVDDKGRTVLVPGACMVGPLRARKLYRFSTTSSGKVFFGPSASRSLRDFFHGSSSSRKTI